MSLSNAAIALDMTIRATEFAMRLNKALRQAEAEGRDISDDELEAIRQENRALLDEMLADKPRR